MSLNFGIEPPRWLQQASSWAGSDERIAAEHEEFRRAEAFPLEIQRLQLGLANQGLQQQQEALGLQESRLKLTEQSREMAEWQKDSKDVIPWLTAPPEQRRSMPPPVPTSNKGIALVTQVQKADDVNAIKQQLADNQAAKVKLQADYDAYKIQVEREKLENAKAIANIRAKATVDAANVRATKGVAFPEPTIKKIDGQDFLFYGNYAPKKLSSLSEEQKAMVNIAQHKLNRLNDNMALVVNDEEKKDLQKQIDEASQELKRLFTPGAGAVGLGGPQGTNAPTSPFKIGRFLVTPQ